jgi:hypothetical protein
VCYQHLLSKVVVWSRPYLVPHEQPFKMHTVPPPIFKAVAAVQRTRGTKRPQPPPAAAPSKAPMPAIGWRAAGGKARREERGEPVRVFHAGCPMLEIDISGKTPVMVLNEFCPKVLRSFPEVVTETTEDSSNPFVTSVILNGVVVAKGGFTNKKMSRQVAARQALSTMCPLLSIEDDQWLGGGAAEPGVGVVDLGNGVTLTLTLTLTLTQPQPQPQPQP